MVNFRRIKIQVSVFYISISFLIIMIFSAIIYSSISNIFVEDGISKTTMAIENSKDILGIYIDKVKGISEIIAENQSVVNYLSNQDGELGHIDKLIDTILKTDDHIKTIIIIGRDGRIISNEEEVSMSTSKDMMEEEWYIEAINNNMPVFTGVRKEKIYSDTEGWVISLSQEITDNAGNNLGVLLIDIKYCFIGDYIEGLDLGSNGYIYMINDQEEIIYHKDTAYYVDEDKKKELIDTYNKGYSYDRELRQLIYSTRIENANWILVGVLSLDGIGMLEKQLFYVVVFLGVLIFIIMLISGTFLADRISKPLRNIEESMNEIEKLDEVKVGKRGFYEITLLEENYNKMIKRIKELMQQLSEKEKQLRKHEVNTLISQINPHFLYNTLDTIIWMAEVGDGSKVIEMTKALARFFRLSLNKGKEFVTIEEEINHIREYLYIQKVRYEDKLEYTINVDSDLLKEKIPKIILQPFVENSIYHGIKNLDGKGHIHIEAKAEADKIVFKVEDNGVGFDGKSRVKSDGSKLGGIGIANVDKRIKLYYGNDYGVSVYSESGKGCRIEVVIGYELLEIV